MNTEKKHNLDSLAKKHGRLSVGQFLKSWRLCEEMSQKEFAKKIKISPANLCDIEKGRKSISPEKAHETALKIGYSPAVLVRMALEEQLASQGLKYRIEVRTAA